jgi:type IV pilus assembly protein PilC
MAQFSYKIKTRSGALQTGTREAASSSILSEQLRLEGNVIIELSEIRKAAEKSPINAPWYSLSWLKPVRSLDIELGLRELAYMLKSGVPIVAALQTVEEQAESPRAALVWARVRERISQGLSVSDAMAAEKGIFAEEQIQLTIAGERTGELEQVFTRAANQLEAKRKLRMAVLNALVYPVLALILAIGVAVYLVASVIPKMAEFLKQGNVELPAITQFLVDVSNWLHLNSMPLCLIIGGAILAWIVVRMNPTGRELEDALLVRLPIAGKVLRLSATTSFARTMALLIESGVPLVDSLHVAANMLNNRRLRARVVAAREGVIKGESLAEALHPAKEFMPMLSRMTAVAETTGDLSETFKEVAEFHDTLLGIVVRRLSVIMEPVMIIITGLIVGFVYLAFFMALFTMGTMS